MKLTKLYIHNYKSFYDTTIELDKLNIVVGENNSGKSNLIDVLEFIPLARNNNFYEAISQKGGFDKILNYNYNEKSIVFELEFENDTFLVKVRFTVNKQVSIVTLMIYAKLENDIIPLHINASRHNRTKNIMKDKMYTYEKNLIKLNLIEGLVEIQFTFAYMLSSLVSSYAFNTEIIRDESHRKAEKELQKNGSNLGQNLLYIKNNYPDSFNIISNSMIGVVNEIKGIDVQETFGNALIGFREQNQEIGIDMVSDGTINLLATITALNQDEDKSILLAFDEPERYLHMKAVHYLMDSFRSSEKQILITTHSTEILKYANLNEVIFIYRDRYGDTQSIRADKIPNLKEKMEHMTYERSMTLDEMIDEDMVWDFE